MRTVIRMCPNSVDHKLQAASDGTPYGWCSECLIPSVPIGSVTTPPVDSAPKKFDTDKLRYGLVDPFALAWLASTLTLGAIKYSAENWRKFPADELRWRYGDALERHYGAWRMGEDDDPETGLPHLAMMMFSAMCLTATFAPRDLKEIHRRTAEAIRRWREKT